MNDNKLPMDDFFEAQERLVTSTFDKAKTYSQVVLSVGYVGLFASWSFTKAFLTNTEVFLSATLATLSLLVFVLFEVITMFFTSWNLLALQQAVQDREHFKQILDAHELKSKKLNISYRRIWVICWGFSVITGVASAGILMGAFLCHLVQGH